MHWYIVRIYYCVLPRGQIKRLLNDIILFISVYGWFQDSFTGVEQDSSYFIEVGYQKGAHHAGLDLLFMTTAGSTLSGPNTSNMIINNQPLHVCVCL